MFIKLNFFIFIEHISLLFQIIIHLIITKTNHSDFLL